MPKRRCPSTSKRHKRLWPRTRTTILRRCSRAASYPKLSTAEIAATIAQEAFFDLDAPIVRVATLDVPIPYNATFRVSSQRAGPYNAGRPRRSGAIWALTYEMQTLLGVVIFAERPRPPAEVC